MVLWERVLESQAVCADFHFTLPQIVGPLEKTSPRPILQRKDRQVCRPEPKDEMETMGIYE